VSKPDCCTRLIQVIWVHQAYAKVIFIMMLHSAEFSRASASCFKKVLAKFTSYGYFASNS
ncbi:MAG: hypothetical protein MJK13_18080, partial [Pseudomonadales bacterium]|nr:hypothetical protein [Pseudomonadales bacterium]